MSIWSGEQQSTFFLKTANANIWLGIGLILQQGINILNPSINENSGYFPIVAVVAILSMIFMLVGVYKAIRSLFFGANNWQKFFGRYSDEYISEASSKANQSAVLIVILLLLLEGIIVRYIDIHLSASYLSFFNIGVIILIQGISAAWQMRDDADEVAGENE